MTGRRVFAALLFAVLIAGAVSAAPGGFTLVNARRVCTNNIPSLTFDWTPSSGASSYSVVRDGSAVSTTSGTSFEDAAVTSGQSYTYVVIASDATGTTQSSNSVTMMAPYCTAPEQPALTATLICRSASPAVTLTWTSAERAEWYDVFRNGIQIRSNLPTSTTSITDSNVTAGTTYSYFVRAMNVSTITPPPPPPSSPGDSNTETLIVTNPCPPPPPAPTVLTSASCGTSAGLPAPRVHVSWNAVSGANGYSLFRNNEFLQQMTGTSYEDPNTIAGNSYTYTVYAFGEGGQGPPGSSTIQVPANICSPPPDAPVLQATSICTPSDTPAVQLTWNNAANATSYTLIRNGAAFASGLTSTSHQDTPAVGASYTYVVRAVNGSGTTDSAPVTINHTDVCPRPPGAFTSSVSVFCSNNAAAVRVTWTSSSGAATYAVIRNGATIASGLTGTSYDDTAVLDGATYSYIVRATNNTGSTDTASNGVTVADPCPRPPGSLTLTGRSFCNGTSPAVYLTWTSAERAVSYSVLRNNVAVATGLTEVTYDDTNVTAITAYTYVIRALNANGSTDSNPFSITPGSCEETPRADLVVSNVTLSRSSAAQGETITVSYTLANTGNAAAGQTQTRIRIGAGPQPSASDVLVFGSAAQAIAAGNSRTEQHEFVVPAIDGGTYLVFVSANDDRATDEVSFANNVSASGPIAITEAPCEVSCLVAAPVRVNVGQSVTFALLSSPSCPFTVTWQFGDNTLGAGQSAMKSYATAGTYTWNVVVAGSGGSSCTNAGTIQVVAPAPVTRRRAIRH